MIAPVRALNLNAAAPHELARIPGVPACCAQALALWAPYDAWWSVDLVPCCGCEVGPALRRAGATLGPFERSFLRR